jgi:beta-lactamase class A
MLKKLVLESINFEKLKCAFVIKNLKTAECASYNENEIVPSASLIKIYVMAEILRQVKEGKLSLKQRILVKEADKVPYSILTLLETSNDYSLKDLLTLMIVQSDNTAANILIDMAGVAEINKFISGLNFKNTILRRKMMDMSARKAGQENLTTASDMARFIELLYLGEVLDQENSTYMIDIMKEQLDNSMIRLYIPDQTVIAHKTGELDYLAHEAGIVFHENGDFIFVIMVWDAVSNNFARQSIGKISKIVYEYFVERSN